jgi:predicted cobalt transporter CbtA
VLRSVFIFTAGVVDTAAGLERAVARDDRVADRQPAVVVIDAAAVVDLPRPRFRDSATPLVMMKPYISRVVLST